jgi:hypothetical protein
VLEIERRVSRMLVFAVIPLVPMARARTRDLAFAAVVVPWVTEIPA